MYVQWYTWGTLLLFLDPCNCELIIFVHLHSNADFIYTPGISSEKNVIILPPSGALEM